MLVMLMVRDELYLNVFEIVIELLLIEMFIEIIFVECVEVLYVIWDIVMVRIL